jgi:organic hydroperoxide reductase OsmC/OhrA
LTSAPAFRGDPTLLNPEQLLVAAASSCQLLAFLGRAARSGIDVVSYEDEALGIMPKTSRPQRVTGITLRPRVTVAAGTPVETVQRLLREAHDGCYIANSVTAEITLEATVIEVKPGRTADAR